MLEGRKKSGKSSRRVDNAIEWWWGKSVIFTARYRGIVNFVSVHMMWQHAFQGCPFKIAFSLSLLTNINNFLWLLYVVKLQHILDGCSIERKWPCFFEGDLDNKGLHNGHFLCSAVGQNSLWWSFLVVWV